jgi:nucleoside phosphorylase
MSRTPLTLVCFAVKEEARLFKESAGGKANLRILLTGMGQRNADRIVRAALAGEKPTLVLTCGFAGGLRPELTAGMVLFATDADASLESALARAGARPGRFHCAARVAATAREKRALWETTGGDAVEMESQIICGICREHNIPWAIVRVILDTADEDLPLDFGQLMTADERMDYGKLALTLMKSPKRIGALVRLQKEARVAAQKLAEVLVKIT